MFDVKHKAGNMGTSCAALDSHPLYFSFTKNILDLSRPGKNIRVWEKSTNPGFLGGKEVSVMTSPYTLMRNSKIACFSKNMIIMMWACTVPS